jgi:hypothetical protein
MRNTMHSPPPPRPMRVAADERRPLTFAETLPGGFMLVIAGTFFFSGIGVIGLTIHKYIQRSGQWNFDRESYTNLIGNGASAAGACLLVSLLFSAIGLYMLRRR